MRTNALKARSFLLLEASLVGGYVVVMLTVAFAKFWGLVVTEEWLGPLMLAMGFEFIAACLLAAHLGTFSRDTIIGLLTIKCLLVLAVAMGFTVQRMNIGPDGQPIDPDMARWGHATIAAAIGFEVIRFVRVLKHFGVPLGPFGEMINWLERLVGGPVRESQMRMVAHDAACEERAAAKQELRESGEIKSSPSFDVLDREDCT